MNGFKKNKLFNIVKKNTIYRAQNNIRTLAGYTDRPKKFQLGHISFLMGQNIEKRS